MSETCPLPEYTGENPRCPKCGGHGAATEFQSVLSVGVYIVAGVDMPDEWLTRTCMRCGYQWREACVSAADRPRQPNNPYRYRPSYSQGDHG